MPTIKGTASVTDDHAMMKLLRKTKFPLSFSKPVDRSKVHAAVMTQWIEEKIASILGFDDEIVQSTAVNLFLPQGTPSEDGVSAEAAPVDPRRAQLDLAGFLGEAEAADFARELWELLLDAQSNPPTGIPRKLLAKKKAELERKHQDASCGDSQHHGATTAAVASGSALPSGGGSEMNRFLLEARQRAEAARQALSVSAPRQADAPIAAALVVPPVAAVRSAPGPVPVSPTLPSRAADLVETVSEKEGTLPQFFVDRGRSRRNYDENPKEKSVSPPAKQEETKRSRSRSVSADGRSGELYRRGMASDKNGHQRRVRRSHDRSRSSSRDRSFSKRRGERRARDRNSDRDRRGRRRGQSDRRSSRSRSRSRSRDRDGDSRRRRDRGRGRRRRRSSRSRSRDRCRKRRDRRADGKRSRSSSRSCSPSPSRDRGKSPDADSDSRKREESGDNGRDNFRRGPERAGSDVDEKKIVSGQVPLRSPSPSHSASSASASPKH